MLAAVLTQPVNSVEEFESRCSALANLLNDLTTGTKANRGAGTEAKGTLQGLKEQLSALLGDEAGRALEAVDVLQRIVRVRAGQQHRGANLDVEQARAALGLTTFGADWTRAWEHLRAVTVRALATIREEVSSLISD